MYIISLHIHVNVHRDASLVATMVLYFPANTKYSYEKDGRVHHLNVVASDYFDTGGISITTYPVFTRGETSIVDKIL